MYDITYNGKSPSYFNAWLATIPVITPSTVSRTRQTIPKRDGDILLDDKSYNDAYVDFTIHAKRTSDLTSTMRQVRRWLSGTGTLVISDATDAYYEVKDVTYTSYLKVTESYGRVSVRMEIYPYEFLNSGNTEISNYASLENPADVSMPMYKISGSGEGVLTVNGHTMSFNADTTLYIDTRNKRALDKNSVVAEGRVSGDYEGLYLLPGVNTITCSTGTLVVTPHWGFRV